MSKADAQQVQKHLEAAREAAKPLKDGSLEKMIEAPIKYVEQKTDPKKGG